MGWGASWTCQSVIFFLRFRCVTAGKLCNEQEAGSLPDRIPPSYLSRLPKIFSIPVGFIDLSEQTAECKLYLVRCAVNRILQQECLLMTFFFITFWCF